MKFGRGPSFVVGAAAPRLQKLTLCTVNYLLSAETFGFSGISMRVNAGNSVLGN